MKKAPQTKPAKVKLCIEVTPAFVSAVQACAHEHAGGNVEEFIYRTLLATVQNDMEGILVERPKV